MQIEKELNVQDSTGQNMNQDNQQDNLCNNVTHTHIYIKLNLFELFTHLANIEKAI